MAVARSVDSARSLRMRIYNKTRMKILGTKVDRAAGLLARMKGLLGTDGLRDGNGLWISPCTGIHSFGMRYEFDALFVDGRMRVVGAYSRFRKNRVSNVFLSARGVVELPPGTIEKTGTEVGDEIEFGP